MGARNVKAVYLQWRHLHDLPFRVLVWMALRSLDDDDPPVYYAGWEELAEAAGREVPAADDEAGELARASSKKAVRDLIRVLRRKGAVKSVGQAYTGQRAKYAIALDHRQGDAHRPPVDNSAKSTDVDREGDAQPTRGGRSADKEGDAQRPPKEEEGTKRKRGRARSSARRAQRDTTAVCPVCGNRTDTPYHRNVCKGDQP